MALEQWTQPVVSGISLWKFHCEEMQLPITVFNLAKVFGHCLYLRPCTSHCCRPHAEWERTLLSMSSQPHRREKTLPFSLTAGNWLLAFMFLLRLCLCLEGSSQLTIWKTLTYLSRLNSKFSSFCRFSGTLLRGNFLFLYCKGSLGTPLLWYFTLYRNYLSVNLGLVMSWARALKSHSLFILMSPVMHPVPETW